LVITHLHDQDHGEAAQSLRVQSHAGPQFKGDDYPLALCCHLYELAVIDVHLRMRSGSCDCWPPLALQMSSLLCVLQTALYLLRKPRCIKT